MKRFTQLSHTAQMKAIEDYRESYNAANPNSNGPSDDEIWYTLANELTTEQFDETGKLITVKD